MSGFDQKCPWCNAPIDCQAAWMNSDHQSEFKFVCGACDAIVSITVHMVPEFETAKPQCIWCQKEIDGTKDYCDPCQKRLREHYSAKGNT